MREEITWLLRSDHDLSTIAVSARPRICQTLTGMVFFIFYDFGCFVYKYHFLSVKWIFGLLSVRLVYKWHIWSILVTFVSGCLVYQHAVRSTRIASWSINIEHKRTCIFRNWIRITNVFAPRPASSPQVTSTSPDWPRIRLLPPGCRAGLYRLPASDDPLRILLKISIYSAVVSIKTSVMSKKSQFGLLTCPVRVVIKLEWL